MTQIEYMQRLEGQLSALPAHRREEILADIQSHFHEGTQSGLEESALAEGLGPPESLGKEFRALYATEQAKDHPSGRNLFRAVLAGIGMGMVNLIFVFPFAAAGFAVWLSLLLSGFAMGLGGIAGALGSLVKAIYPAMPLIHIPYPWPMLFASLAMAALGGLLIIGMILAGRALGKAIARYIQANLDIVLERKRQHATKP